MFFSKKCVRRVPNGLPLGRRARRIACNTQGLTTPATKSICYLQMLFHDINFFRNFRYALTCSICAVALDMSLSRQVLLCRLDREARGAWRGLRTRAHPADDEARVKELAAVVIFELLCNDLKLRVPQLGKVLLPLPKNPHSKKWGFFTYSLLHLHYSLPYI